MTAVAQILRLLQHPDPYRAAPANLGELQLEALRERFAERRPQIRILDRRAAEAGIVAIGRTADLVPLLFSHTSYKSYPEQFVDNGQWSQMNRWLQTMSSRPVQVDVAGAVDVDDWLARLRAAGHHVFATSGTSGKGSFLNRTPGDLQRSIDSIANAYAWANPVGQLARDRPAFRFFPPAGAHPMCEIMSACLERVAAPGQVHFMSLEPMRAMQTIRAGRMRRAMAAGTARPEEIVAFEREAATTRARMDEQVDRCIDLLLEHRRQPVLISAQWPFLYRIATRGRQLGVKDGDFHPETIVYSGGGVKGTTLPADYREQVQAFLGLPLQNYLVVYGMSEMTGVCPYSRPDAGYAIPPWIVPLVLDKGGERLLADGRQPGAVEGRMALFDLALEGRWGGVISGDKVTVDFSPGADGVVVPRVRTVARYAELEEGEDKLTCAGTIDAYVRGAIGA